MSDSKDLPPPYSARDSPGVHTYHQGPPPAFYPPGPPPSTIYPPPPQQGYYQPPPPPSQGYGATSTTIIVENPDVIVIGACPACRVGVLEDDFTCLGLLCAIFFFPLGILCCLALREKRCANCGASFG